MARQARENMIKGAIVSLNISPKGVYEGAVIETASGMAQVNFYPEFGAYIGSQLQTGEKIDWQVAAEEEDKNAAHPVYYLQRYIAKNGKEITLDESHKSVSSKGTVKQLNYALHGEPNGVILDNGDFIHVKPKGFKEAGLEIGQKITIKGELKPSCVENRVIEAFEINGSEIGHGHKEKHKSKKAA